MMKCFIPQLKLKAALIFSSQSPCRFKHHLCQLVLKGAMESVQEHLLNADPAQDMWQNIPLLRTVVPEGRTESVWYPNALLCSVKREI